MKLKTVKISQIKQSTYKLRFRTEEEELATLQASIEEHGLLVPPIVIQKAMPMVRAHGSARA